jgi:glycosyltransferase involved in cell wall biosynthesis
VYLSRRASTGHGIDFLVSTDVLCIRTLDLCHGGAAHAVEVVAMIVHVGPSHLPLPARLGGAVERRMMELAEAQARSGEQIVVYSGGTETGWRPYHGVTIRYLHGTRLEFALSFVQDVARVSPRVLHVHNRAEIAWLVKAAGIGPTVLSCDYPYEPWRRFAHLRRTSKAIWRQCLLACDRIAPVSNYCLNTYRQYWDLPGKKWVLIPNGVDIPDLGPPVRTSDGTRRVLYLARIHPKKGVSNLLRAWSLVESRFAEWQLRIVGPDNDGHLAEMRDLARALDLRRAELVGFVPESQKSAEYLQADLYVLPTYNENWGVTIADALSHAVPAIIGRGAPWQGLETHDCGWWVDNSPASLARCFESALTKSRDELHAMGQRGREWMAVQFGWPGVADQMRRVYRWLVDGGVPPDTVISD